MAVCQRGAHPDLAHAFLNHLLDTRVGVENFCWNGYQPPLEGVTREVFAAPDSPWHMEVPPNLLDTLLDDRVVLRRPDAGGVRSKRARPLARLLETGRSRHLIGRAHPVG